MRKFRNVNTGICLSEEELLAMYLREFKSNEVTELDYSMCKTIEELENKIIEYGDEKAKSWVFDEVDFAEIIDEEE